MKIIIIGAGLAGLSAGIYARKAGYEVEIVEKNNYAGGLCTGWTRKGSYIEGCIHWLTESKKGDLNKIWHEIGALDDTVTIYDGDTFYEVNINGHKINMWTDLVKLEKELDQYATPNDKKILKKFIKNIKKSMNCGSVPSKKPFHLWTMMEGLSYGMKMLPLIKVMKEYGTLSIEEFGQQFESEELKFFFTNSMIPSNYSTSSLLATLGGLMIKNSGVPSGGSKPLIERVTKKYEALGGKLNLNCNVDEILVENDVASGVQLSDGTVYNADYIVSALDLHYLTKHLLKNKYEISEMMKRDQDKIKNPTCSLITAIYRTNADLSRIAQTSFYKTNEYTVLNESYTSIGIKHFGYEPTLIQNGKTVVQVNLITNEDQYNQIEKMSKEEYKAFKQEISDKFKEIIVNLIPEMEELEDLDVVTPKTYVNYVNAYKGSFMAYAMTPNNKQMMIMNNELPIKNIILASQWQMTPGGTPVAVVQGKFAIQTIQALESKKNN
ncbi:phytoene desaturase family protein [Anaerorhabdus furcosa]|uniref:Phytoene dehydrogenase-related protein n=1 Tax=Anaerorhabdus furcosa TaxID=118967 RepID=A0A1T4N5S1_9FIRM|nr:FAD-dependent oxidoreductase [Anaerorhabdus furcosa]SJZ74395.1 Phytoene dehydrogenase-related protein [Anaerorhabdus furcosa]